ncbi:hypothetical protein CapIbe_013286 [Capra ibex]
MECWSQGQVPQGGFFTAEPPGKPQKAVERASQRDGTHDLFSPNRGRSSLSTAVFCRFPRGRRRELARGPAAAAGRVYPEATIGKRPQENLDTPDRRHQLKKVGISLAAGACRDQNFWHCHQSNVNPLHLNS